MKTYNNSPYFDDFDEDKNFHQIMFNPGYAVQARELTQIQTIMRNQVEKFGNHIFQQGSIVIPGNSYADLAAPYVELNGTITALGNLNTNLTLIGLSSGVEAKIRKIIAPEGTDQTFVYASYTKGSTAGDVIFRLGETIAIKESSSNTFNMVSQGVGSIAFINRGVYYINGTFVTVESQSVVISKKTSTPSCSVLLKITEEIVTSVDDETLLDPARGSYNYAAPGADRVKISTTLTKLDLGEPITDDYIEIMRYNNGVIEEHARTPKYSELEKSLARRTYDESGNYVVSGLRPTIREHIKTRNNGGVYFDGDEDKMVVDVSAGKAYIKGFEIEKISNTYLTVDKGRTADHIKNTTSIIRPQYGQTLLIADVFGTFSISVHEEVELWNTSDHASGTATKIGTAKIIGFDYHIGDVGTGAIYKVQVSEIKLLTGYTNAQIGGIRVTSGSKRATVITQLSTPITSGGFQINENVTHTSGRIGKVRYWDVTKSMLYVEKTDEALETPRVGDAIIGSISTTTSTVNNKFIVISNGQSPLIFTLPKSVIYSIKDPVSGTYNLSYTAQKEFTIITDGSGDGSVSASTGEVIDSIEVGTFMALSASGIVQNSLFSLNVDGTTLTLAGGPLSTTVKVYASVTKTDVSPRTKTENTFSEVISSPTNIVQLSKPDVFEIVSVIDSIGDKTANYTFDTGQKDHEYQKGSLILLSGSPAPVGDITVTYKHYTHSTSGDFFCKDSYPADILDRVNEYTAADGTLFNLSSCIDFRPVVGADNTLSGAGAKINSKIVPDNTFMTTLQFYVPRIDSLTMSVNGTLSIKRGIPSEDPISVAENDQDFYLNKFWIPAYTSDINLIINKRMDVERFTMMDIKTLERRVANVEEYATLTAAEMSTTKEDIIDAATGLSRFKTGYIVENFEFPMLLARKTHADYKSYIDNTFLCPNVEYLKCFLFADDFSNMVSTSNVISLPYTEEVFASQLLSSRVTNINPFLVISWDGSLSVVPNTDNWTEVFDNPTIFDTRTDINYVYVSVPCPPPPAPPRPAPSYPSPSVPSRPSSPPAAPYSPPPVAVPPAPPAPPVPNIKTIRQAIYDEPNGDGRSNRPIGYNTISYDANVVSARDVKIGTMLNPQYLVNQASKYAPGTITVTPPPPVVRKEEPNGSR